MSTSLPTDWDSLRRMAKQMEAECENSLASFARHASTAANAQHGAGPSLATTERTEAHLEDLLRRLALVVEQMANAMTPSSPSSWHLLVQRQRDTLMEHTREFRRIKANLIAAREHSELLNSVQSDIHAHKYAKAQGTDYFLTERNKLDSTHVMIDDIIEQAHETRTNLDAQRETLLGAHRRITGLHTVFPQLAGLMTRIRLRRRRDTIILSLVTASCMFLLFLYYT